MLLDVSNFVVDALNEQRDEAGGSTVRALELDVAGARFTAALSCERSLEDALAEAGASFDFEVWLIVALREGTLSAVQPAPPRSAEDRRPSQRDKA